MIGLSNKISAIFIVISSGLVGGVVWQLIENGSLFNDDSLNGLIGRVIVCTTISFVVHFYGNKSKKE